jgi:DNA-binding CsgD family transcriptional regulator
VITDVERGLIERIALKEAVALRLNQRQRRILCARLEGYTFREISKKFGVSLERVRQIERFVLARLHAPKLGLIDGVPLPGPPAAKRERRMLTERFDGAAFLKHMEKLILLREQAEQRHAAFVIWLEEYEKRKERMAL